MSFNISPSVNFTETDTTLAVTQLANNIGAIAITSEWGPAEYPTRITLGESEIVDTFGKPSSDIDGISQWVAIDYSGYSNSLYVTRAIGPAAKNAVPENKTTVLVKNIDDLEQTALPDYDFIGRYPGAKANGLVIDIVDSNTFDTWEYKSAFNYAPLANEYHLAIIDTLGNWKGTGSSYQTEAITVKGSAVGGVKEIRTLTFTGPASGGIQQRETLTVSGVVSAGGNITVDGVVVAVAKNDTAAVVAGKIQTALAAVTATYTGVTNTGNSVSLAFVTPGARTPIADVSSLGVTVTSVIDVIGSDDVLLSIYGKNIYVKNGDTAAQVVAKALPVFAADTRTFDSAVQGNTTAKIVLTYADFGAQSYPTTTQTSHGISAATNVDTAGNGDITLSIWGHSVPVSNGNTAAQVATAIAGVLSTALSSTYNNIVASGSNVFYTYPTVGLKTKQTSPTNQYGLVFGIDVSLYGSSGSLIEKFELLSNDITSRNPDGSTNYFADVINRTSKYIWVADETVLLDVKTVTLHGGVDDNLNVDFVDAITLFSDSEKYDFNYIIDGSANSTVQKTVADVASDRRDIVAFVSPEMSDVVFNKGGELAAVLDWRNNKVNRESSYLFNDSNWAYIYDNYNDKYRWIPCSGGTAGLQARAAANFNAWTSPAFHNRGQYKRYIKLAWSPNKGQRDELYKAGINPVVNFPGQGILLYGDKTSVSRPSAFDHINVRNTFIVMEKSIANFAKYFLGELNDQFTRNQFLNAVRPFLRSMQAQRAFEDFKVVCDVTNNTGQVLVSNELVGTILVKPLYSINYITLNFIATRPDVSFDEITSSLF